MRRKKAARYASAAPAKANQEKPLFKRTYMKVISMCTAFLLVALTLAIPSRMMITDAEAIVNKKAVAFSAGDLKTFSKAIVDTCAPVQEETTAETTRETTQPETEATTATEETTQAQATEPVTEAPTEKVTEAAEVEEETVSAGNTADYVSQSVSKSSYLLAISNPDPSYNPGTVTLSDGDRDLLERLVMGEAGSLGYTGCALIAQAVKDAMLTDGITTVAGVISSYGYVASTSIKPNSAAQKAVSYIFDENGSAVQHRILYFYESSICDSKWHESQNFIVDYYGVKFFDRW